MSALNDKEREELVAFLDGELDDKRARAVAARISLDPGVRAEADGLRQAWELLEYLPRAEPSTSFTNRTLERLAITHRPTAAGWGASGRWRRLLLAVSALVAAGLGFGIMRWWPVPTPPAGPPEVQVQQGRESTEEQWRRALPLAVRDNLRGLQGKALTDRLAQLHEEERQRRLDWQVARHLWPGPKGHWPAGRPVPVRWADLDAADRQFLEEYLRPQLPAPTWEKLEKMEHPWPRFARTLVELADQHPVALAGPRGPTRVKELPREVVSRLGKLFQQKFGKGKKATLWGRLAPYEGKWPGFAVKVTETARALDLALPHELWPARRKDLSWGVQEFLEKKLEVVLDAKEKGQLRQAEGRWPRYPQTIQELAGKHSLMVPWQTLPGPRARWDGYRVAQEMKPSASGPH